jgi:hypothetical protein
MLFASCLTRTAGNLCDQQLLVIKVICKFQLESLPAFVTWTVSKWEIHTGKIMCIMCYAVNGVLKVAHLSGWLLKIGLEIVLGAGVSSVWKALYFRSIYCVLSLFV